MSAVRELSRGFEVIRDERVEAVVRADVREPVQRLLQQCLILCLNIFSLATP